MRETETEQRQERRGAREEKALFVSSLIAGTLSLPPISAPLPLIAQIPTFLSGACCWCGGVGLCVGVCVSVVWWVVGVCVCVCVCVWGWFGCCLSAGRWRVRLHDLASRGET